MTKASHHDFVIVGAGSAGCVLAARLSEAPSCRVLLLEAGGADRGHLIHMPAAAPMAARDKRWDWGYLSEPEPTMEGRRIIEHRGRVLGGSSSINGMVANRGNPRDYDGWAAEGLPSWSYAHCLPYFRRMETFDRGASPWRGGEGPQSIETCKADHRLDQAFLAAGEQAGYAFTPDQNGATHEGFHVAQSFTKGGKRCSAAAGHLRSARGRPNLTVLTGAHARRVVFDGKRAVAVEVERNGQVERHEAAREVILAAGAINSPQLLLLSGVGDPTELRQHGIAAVAEVPAVGRNLEDHMIVPIAFATPAGVSLGARLAGWRRWRVGLEWLLAKRGIGASTLCETGCFFKSSDGVDYADLQHEFYALTASFGEAVANWAEGFMFSMGIMRPESRGWVKLASADPKAAPRFSFNYLATEGDRRVMIDGVRRTREMAAQKAFDGLRTKEMSPGPDAGSDAEILAWLRSAGSSEYHPCSTCRMGTGADSVVDEQARVHGLEGLRVVDASIMPHNVTANLNAPVIMLAEKLSDTIAGRPPLAPLRPAA